MDLQTSQPTIEELFQQTHQYQVPRYQRAYSWQKSHVEALWTDLASVENRPYFLGPMVVHHPKGDGARAIIDGQQRLTTLQILLALLRDEFIERGDPVRDPQNAPTPYSRRLNYLIRDAYNEERFRLRSGEYNREVLEDFILREPADAKRKNLDDPQDVKGLSPVVRARNQDLIGAYRALRGFLKDRLNKADDPIASLCDLDQSIRKNVTLFVLDVSDLDDAYTLFERLNDRGLQLSSADLLKSHLLASFEKAHAGDDAGLEAAAQDWDDMVDILGGGDISGFLRHYLLINHRRVRKDEVFGLFKESVKKDGPLATQQRLTDMGVVYADLVTPPLDGTMLSQTLRDLSSTGVDTHRIALMPALRHLAPNLATGFARLAEIVSFRWAVTNGNAQVLETIYHDVATTLDDSRGAKLAEAEEQLRSVMPDDDAFGTAFGRESLGYQFQAAYALRRIELALNPNEFMFKPGGQVHVEHIMPRTASDFWRGRVIGDVAYEAAVPRWGNLTLLLDRTNQSISNGNWDVKRFGLPTTDGSPGMGGYSGSGVRLTSDLAKLDDWTTDDIALRSRWLGAIAVHVWSLAPVSKGLPPYSAVRADPEMVERI